MNFTKTYHPRVRNYRQVSVYIMLILTLLLVFDVKWKVTQWAEHICTDPHQVQIKNISDMFFSEINVSPISCRPLTPPLLGCMECQVNVSSRNYVMLVNMYEHNIVCRCVFTTKGMSIVVKFLSHYHKESEILKQYK